MEVPIVKVKYFRNLRNLLNVGEEEYNVEDGTTIINLLFNHVPKRHWNTSSMWREKLFETEDGEVKRDREGIPILRDFYIILVNEKHLELISKDGGKYRLKNGDAISIFPSAGGG